MATSPARGHQQILMEMQGKRPQDFVRLALGVHCPGQARMQAFDGQCHRLGAPLGTVLAQPGTLAQALRYLLQLLLRLGLHRVDFQPVGQHLLQLPLTAPPVPALTPRPPAPCSAAAGFRPGWRAGRAVPGVERQGHTVNRLRGRMQQQVATYSAPSSCLKVACRPLEDDFPGVRLSAQGILAFPPGELRLVVAWFVFIRVVTLMAGRKTFRFPEACLPVETLISRIPTD